jgi:hypothetical protein
MPELSGNASSRPGQALHTDLRPIALFLILTTALLAPFAWQALLPTDSEDLKDFASTLASDAREAARILDRRDSVTPTYYAAELEDLGDSITSARGTILHRPVQPDVTPLRQQLMELAKTFADATEGAALAWDDAATRVRARAAFGVVAAEAERLGDGS